MSRTHTDTAPAPPATATAERPSPYLTFGATSLVWVLALGLAAVAQRLGAGLLTTIVLGGAAAAVVTVLARRRLARPGAAPPWWMHWDVVGYTAAVSAAALATIVAVETLRGGPGLLRTTRVALPVALMAVALVATVGLALARRHGSSPREAAADLVRVWTDPAADWTYFVLGALLGLPLMALLGPVVWDSDSMRVLSSTSRARHDGLGFLVETQQVFLPVLLFTPVVAVAGIYGAVALSIATMQALLGIVAYITRKLTGGVLAPIAAVLALLLMKPLVEQAGLLPMYPLMFTLGYLGGWIGLRAVRADGRARLGLAVLTGFLLASTAEAHDIGKLFFAVPAFLLALEPSRKGLKAVALIYLALAVLYIPRAAVNLAEGGFDRFLTNRADWMTGQGYLRMINREFWGHPVTDKVTFFAEIAQAYWRGSAGLVAVPLGLAVAAFIAAGRRAKVFALVAGGLMFYLLVRARIPPHARYVSPLLPGLAIAGGVGLWVLWKRGRSAMVAGAVILALLAGAAVSYVRTVDVRHMRQQAVLGGELKRIVDRIDDDRRVMGVRATRIMSVDPHVRLASGRLGEEGLVTYLTWPSEREVLELLRTHDIGWLLVLTNRRLEVDYHNTWVEPVHGERVRHADMIEASPSFCEVAGNRGFILYRVGPCPP